MLTGARRCRAFPSWNAWLKLVRGTRGVPKCRLRLFGPPGLPPLVIRTVAGTLSKRGGTQIEGQVEQRQRRHQAAGYPLLACVDSESVQSYHTAV